MENERYLQLQSIISQFTCIYQFLDDSLIRKQCESGLKNYLLKCLVNKESSHIAQQHLPNLESRLAKLAPVNGYDKLKPRLRDASDFDSYDDIYAQMDITLWFKEKGLVKEIEPKLPNKDGYSDILLFFSQQDIYCEITSFQSIIKSTESKEENQDAKIQNKLQKLRKRQPWLTAQYVKDKLETDKAVTKLLDKTKRQLPPDYPGVLALDSKAGILQKQQIRKIADRLFPKRPQLALIMRRSLSQIEIPTLWFVNLNSPYQNIGRELLKYLGQDNNIFDC